jgi:hypothetical protein
LTESVIPEAGLASDVLEPQGAIVPEKTIRLSREREESARVHEI